MSDLTKRYSLLSGTVLICSVSGCTTVDAIFSKKYIDYTTDKVEYIDIEPEAAAALPGRGEVGLGLYAAAGIGVSYLTPDTSAAANVDVDESAVPAGQATLGMDINKHLAFEMHSADLGSAGLSPEGRINYQLNGASALYYAGKNRGVRGRRGLSMFGRFGVGAMENSPIGPVSFTREDEVRPLYGAGLEYNGRSGFGARAELIHFDSDAQYAQFGLMYRLGQRNRKELEIVEMIEPATQNLAVSPVTATASATAAPVISTPVPDPKPIMAPPPVILAAATPKDTDLDRIADSRDKCPNTPISATVDSVGCPIFAGTIEGVNFKTASAELTDQAVDILDDISAQLMDYPGTMITIKAHTDNQGESSRNQKLSEQRARTVADFFARRGIPYSRMKAKAYGERSPIDTNDTAAGRANNRRVEIFASNVSY